MIQARTIIMALLAISYAFAPAQAQVADTTQSTDTTVHRHRLHTFIEPALTYQSNDVYLGRKPAHTLPYFIPAFSYYHKSGFFASTSLDYLKDSSVSRIDLFTLEAGYMFKAHKYDGTIILSKYFYNSQSTNLTSAITTAIAYQNGYDFGFIKPGFTLTLNIGNKLDYEGLFELSHTFSLAGDNLDITPTIAAAGSTLNYYDYYRQRLYKIKKKKVVQTGTASVTSSVVNASTFRLMDYEPTIPIEYTLGKCTLDFTPTYSIPVNPSTLVTHTIKTDGTTTNTSKTEKLSNTFFFTLGISFLF